ncbi:MAG: hypothetical protein M1834_005045 [Cirrosporium novae-zelandiae]|nr:MAG: hypothetical protein M1834_005045 [Cirrosporium novae-zelandiae]
MQLLRFRGRASVKRPSLQPTSIPQCWNRGAATSPAWGQASVLDQWVQREARPISLRQLTFFGRTLTEHRLLSSANYVRTELPTRIAHRLRDMQTLPYVVVTNKHMSHVYDLYHKAFEAFRKVKDIRTIEDNDDFCDIINKTLREHLTVIPSLAVGVIECQGLMDPEGMDKFINTMLRSRISRRVIAEQHLSLTETFHSPWHFPNAQHQNEANTDFVGEVFLRCSAKEVVEHCGKLAQDLARHAFGSKTPIPQINIRGHLDATFPYILSHLEYIIGELLRNSIQALIERQDVYSGEIPPIEVLICEAPQHVIIRVSDQGGGVPHDVLPYLWSFSKGPRSQARLKNLLQVPKMAATMQELRNPPPKHKDGRSSSSSNSSSSSKQIPSNKESSLSSLTFRPPNLRLGMGLPLSRIFAEYWAGSLALHSLEGYGADAFLQISKLGNKNEQLTTRASMDAV